MVFSKEDMVAALLAGFVCASKDKIAAIKTLRKYVTNPDVGLSEVLDIVDAAFPFGCSFSADDILTADTEAMQSDGFKRMCLLLQSHTLTLKRNQEASNK